MKILTALTAVLVAVAASAQISKVRVCNTTGSDCANVVGGTLQTTGGGGGGGVVEGRGTAGSPDGGVLTVQGAPGGTPLPVSLVGSDGGPLPVVGPLTDTELRATPVPVSLAGSDGGTITVQGVDGGVPVGVSGTVTANQGAAGAAAWPVSGTFWQATQPVSGPLTDTQLRASAVPVSGTFWQATQPISAGSLPLPFGAATSAAQTDGSQVAQAKLQDGSGTAITSTASGGHQGLDVTVLNGTSGTVTANQGTAGVSAWPVSAAQSGAPWSFKLSLGGSDVASGNPLPVYFASAQVVSGTVTVQQSTRGSLLGNMSLQMAGVDVDTTHPVYVTPGTGASWAVTGPLTDTQLRASAVPVSGTFWQTTQPVSGTVAATQSGSWSATVSQGTRGSLLGNMTLQLGGVDVDSTHAVPVTPGSGASWAVTGTFYQATQPVSIASMPSTPVTNANLDAALSTLATSAHQTDGNQKTQVTALPALPAGSNVIGHVIADSGSTTAVTGTVTVLGGLTNNNAAPGATNIGVLSGIANAKSPVLTEGYLGAVSLDLSGRQRTAAVTRLVDRINWILYSQDFTNAVWSHPEAGTTVTADTTVAPDGTTTADTVTYDGTSGTSGGQRLYQATVLNTSTNGLTYTTAVWLKSISGAATVDLTGGPSASRVSCALNTARWTLCSTTITGTGSSNAAFNLDSHTGDNSAFSLALWGAQIEQNDTATAYIPTTAQPVMALALTGTLGTSGAAVPPYITQIGGSDGTNLYQIGVDASRNVRTRAAKKATAPLATAVSVTSSATAIPATPLTDRTSLCVTNNGAVTIYLGGSGVTTAAGTPLGAGGTWCDDVGVQVYYGVSAGTTVDVRALEN